MSRARTVTSLVLIVLGLTACDDANVVVGEDPDIEPVTVDVHIDTGTDRP